MDTRSLSHHRFDNILFIWAAVIISRHFFYHKKDLILNPDGWQSGSEGTAEYD